MPRTHYDTLGIAEGATPDEVRSAYRKLVLKHHPDHSKDPRSKEIFMRVTEAYEVLGDPERRAAYDQGVRQARKTRDETKRRIQDVPPEPPPTKAPPRSKPDVASDVTRLTTLYRQGKHGLAESLARQILERDAKQPVAYAILGDLARARGNAGEAMKMYAFAAQMAPGHPEYEARYLEMLNVVEHPVGVKERQGGGAMLLAGGTVICCGIYLVLSNERPLLPSVSLISSFTLGLIVMALIAGIAIGASFGLGGLVDRFSTTAFDTMGRISPAIAVGLFAIVNFWLGAAFYLVVGATKKCLHYSATRLVVATAATATLFGLCAMRSDVLNGAQTFLWSGNLVYWGAIIGWLASDAFRR